MPTKKQRVNHIAENLPAQTTVEETCPSVYTAAALKQKRPDAYAGVVQGLVEGTPLTRIQKRYKVGAHTIAVVRSREKEIIAQCKLVMQGLIGYAAQSSVEKYIERLEADKIPDGVLPIATGILIDKARAADGEPSQVIEVKRSVTLDEVKAELDEMKKAEVIEAEVVDIDEDDNSRKPAQDKA
tara:strand:+ start:181 stop:732 length:552 start_codon:yes stop_codon:yes gene_type:complete